MVKSYALYFDRNYGTIHGAVTLQEVIDGKPTPIFHRLPANSGQYPYTDGGAEDWVTGKGPTPMGRYWISTKREALQMEPKGTPFYCISSKQGSRIIHGPNLKTRSDIGLHLENRFPGSAGCCVLVCDTPEHKQRAYNLFTYLDKLNAAGIEHIPFIVL